MRIDIEKAGTKVFLGGTCNGDDWRKYVTERLSVPFFNPVVDGEWTAEHAEEEVRQREMVCSHNVYVLTPYTKGFYAIAELVEDSINKSDRTFVCFLKRSMDESREFSEDLSKSIDQTIKLLKQYHNNVFDNLDDLVTALNRLP